MVPVPTAAQWKGLPFPVDGPLHQEELDPRIWLFVKAMTSSLEVQFVHGSPLFLKQWSANIKPPPTHEFPLFGDWSLAKLRLLKSENISHLQGEIKKIFIQAEYGGKL